MSSTPPNVGVIAGPNGSGKLTAAPDLLRDYLGISEFVNANVIAQGLSGFRADSVAMQAGRIMLARWRELARQRVDFAFETTPASRSFAPWLHALRHSGYRIHLLFLWLPSPELAIARVTMRVQQGGHAVPDEIIKRRYHAGLRNFLRL
jgi:predicted ABC-type ATPase